MSAWTLRAGKAHGRKRSRVPSRARMEAAAQRKDRITNIPSTCWSQSLRVRGTFVPFSTQFLVELSVGSLPLSVCICYTSFALVAEILRKGGGAFDAIPMDHFYTMRDLQEWVARHRTVSGRSESLSVSSTILRPSLASPYSS